MKQVIGQSTRLQVLLIPPMQRSRWIQTVTCIWLFRGEMARRLICTMDPALRQAGATRRKIGPLSIFMMFQLLPLLVQQRLALVLTTTTILLFSTVFPPAPIFTWYMLPVRHSPPRDAM